MSTDLDSPFLHWLDDLSAGAVNPGDHLYCSGCQAPITSRRYLESVQGSHYHRFSNPYGLSFNLACFRLAPGCVLMGAATREHTWFSGFSWQMCLCEECSQHLGWHYQRGEEEDFFALIVDRLLAAGPTS